MIISSEGYNGALTVPHDLIGEVQVTLKCVLQDPLFDINIGQSYNHLEVVPFKKLIVKEKPSIITDGFNSTYFINEIRLDDTGEELSPQEWQKQLVGNKNAIILDCRNHYESAIGRFENAIPLNTTKYSESWDSIDAIMSTVDKDVPVYTYCTGGIRCVKIGAYLRAQKQFKNVYRLQKGIIAYENWRKSNENKEVENLFIGQNYLFDRRRDDN